LDSASPLQQFHEIAGDYLYFGLSINCEGTVPKKKRESGKQTEKVDKGFLSRPFRNIARMAPDVLDVVVGTLGNPLAGLGVAAKKIAEKAKEETSAS
jgi:hypothetical protein